jgi:3-oxoacyl-[acyl-carrier protein] reductase
MILKDKNVVITGSGRGIGRKIAIECAKEGANVGITSRTIKELNETKEQIKNLNPDCKMALKTADITKYSEVEELFSFFQKELGPLNAVIANAGIAGRYDTHKFIPEKFAQIMDVNVNGVFYTFRAAYNMLITDDKKDKARFIITGSAAYPNAMPKYAAYTASKYAVVGFQKALAMEYRRENININSVLPTMVDTQLLRGDKAGDGNAPPNVMAPSELAKYYIFLLSDDANRVNDELISINQFEQYINVIHDTSEEYKKNWKTFKQYLEENKQSIYENIKSQKRLARFLLHWEK